MLQRHQSFPLALAAKAAVSNPPEGLANCSWWPQLGEEWLSTLCLKIDVLQESLPDEILLEDTSPFHSFFTEDDHPIIASALLTSTLLAPSFAAVTSASTDSSYSSNYSYSALNDPLRSELVYGASTRAFIARTLVFLGIPHYHLLDAERMFSRELYNQLQQAEMKEQSEKLRKEQESGWGGSVGRHIATASGVTIGGVVLGVTGGLVVAPALLPFLPFLTGVTGPVLFGSLFGLAGGGLTGHRVRRRWTGVERFEFIEITGEALKEAHDSGSDDGKQRNFIKPPSIVATMIVPGIQLESENQGVESSRKCLKVFESSEQDVYVVSHSPDAMLSVGNMLRRWVMTTLLTRAGREILKRTAFNAVVAAVAMPIVIYRATGMAVDNAWIRAKDKARKAGVLLGDVIQERLHGNRPLNLIGSSIGGSTLFEALLYLAKARQSKDSAKFQAGPLIDSVVFISLPEAPTRKEWGLVRSVVSRRIVNAYCWKDFVLASVGRLHEVVGGANFSNMAGLGAIPAETSSMYGIENVDISDIIEGHFDLAEKMPAILKRIDLDERASKEDIEAQKDLITVAL